jgi:glycosyltransferase involved in cell wall biosynthesis
MPYKILVILTPAFDPNAGGVQRSTYKMSSYFKSKGHSTHVFSYQQEGHGKQEVATLYMASAPEGQHNPSNNHELKTLLTKLEPDVVINQMPYEREIGLVLSAVHAQQKFLLLGCLRNTLFSVKLNLETYIEHLFPGLMQPFFKNKFGKQILLKLHRSKHAKDLKYILDTYDYFVMFGPPNLKELQYFVGNYKLDKTYLIPNSILSVLPKVPTKEKRILWLSRLDYRQKRADLILPFWKKVMHQLPDWQFDIVGDGDAFEDIKAEVERDNIPRVTLYGKQKPDDFYKRSPIYIMTSSFEGFPNTLIEAQSFGAVPVVYDNYPICSWAVKEGESGVLVPPFNISAMANEVISLAQDEHRQKHLMQKALDNAREFEINNVGKKWVEFFDFKLN